MRKLGSVVVAYQTNKTMNKLQKLPMKVVEHEEAQENQIGVEAAENVE